MRSTINIASGKGKTGKNPQKGASLLGGSGGFEKAAEQITPMMEQYNRLKRDHQGEVLFFRLGDFYEMFGDQAVEIASLLNLTLTRRNGLPMCGVPYHAARSYIARLLRLGKKVAVCEQLSEPGKGLVERKVVEVITPGTTVEEYYLDKGNANYLAALALYGSFLSFAYIDISAGEFYAASIPFEEEAEPEEKLKGELERLQIREMIVQESLLREHPSIARIMEERHALVLNRWADWLFDYSRSLERLERQFGAQSLKSFGISAASPEIIAAGALLDYLDSTAQGLIPHVRTLSLYTDSEFLGIDEASQRNLELVRNLQDGDVKFSLLEVMDETRTAMGKRLLKKRILHPLRNLEKINARLDMVDYLYHAQEKLNTAREILGRSPDLERLISRLAMDKAHGKDMVSIKNGLLSFESLAAALGEAGFCFESPEARSLDREGLERLTGLRALLDAGLAEEPSILLTEGNLIREGFDPALDNLRQLKDSGRRLLEEYLEEEKLKTGIPSLKIRYNKLIGYFFEVTKVHLTKVPPYFIRRQGIAGGERFSTERLAALESDINGAEDRAVELERKLFLEIREEAKKHLTELTAAGKRIAEIDAAQSLAMAVTIHNWVRPQLNSGNKLRIIEGRHPVVEAHLRQGEFIPNDTFLAGASSGGAPGGEEISFALITGPNMAGKSTYLRQTALIVIMAQAGSFVPAREAEIGLTDRIYCRVGAQDNLARGESTFLVEMNETAYILHTATRESLVIMDEVGRGTGTMDGLSIAWAVCEELLNNKRCRTLFATHYHELSRISHPRLANRSMDIVDDRGELVFLRKLKEGPSSESYGLQVARLAGLPEEVLQRAEEILRDLKRRETREKPGRAPASPPLTETAPLQEAALLVKALQTIDPDAVTPLEALKLLHDWKISLSQAPRRGRSSSPPPRDRGNPSLFDLS